MTKTNNNNIVTNYFTNENPENVKNTTNTFGIIGFPPNVHAINPAQIEDGITDRGAGLGKLGSSMPSPMARLFLFSAAFEEVNAIEAKYPQEGHIGLVDNNGDRVLTPYHDLVSELLDMLEFIFKYGDEYDFKVVSWDVNTDCPILEQSGVEAHKKLSTALKSAFETGELSRKENNPIFIFMWNDIVIGGTSPISLVYTSANLRNDLQKKCLSFTGDKGNKLFADQTTPLHNRSDSFKEYLYRLFYTDMVALPTNAPLNKLAKYIQDSASNYDSELNNSITPTPKNYQKVKMLLSQEGQQISVGDVKFRVSDHTIVINKDTTDYLLKPSVNVYQHGHPNTKVPLILTKYGNKNLIYAVGRPWNTASDSIPHVLSQDIYNRSLPGLGDRVKYPYLTVDDFFEPKIIEVSYEIDKQKFFTGCSREISFLLPLRKIFFEYFSLNDLVRVMPDGSITYTQMLKMEYDEEHQVLSVSLTLPLENEHSICLTKTYDTADDSIAKVNCYDASNTFDFAIFPFYRLEPDTSHNVYNIMTGASVDGVSMKFYEPQPDTANNEVPAEIKHRAIKGQPAQAPAQLSTNHIRVNNVFSYIELTVTTGGQDTSALVIPLFKKLNSDPAIATDRFKFAIDFGTTNTHVAYAQKTIGNPFGLEDVHTFGYGEKDPQMVMFNNIEGVREFGQFTTAVKRELVPLSIGNANSKFPMRTATYQVAGAPANLEMFFNTNIGFNYGEDISRSKAYKTNIKWDRFDAFANDRMKTYFAQMLWMMKNKSVRNDCTDNFDLVVTYPISMRHGDLENFKQAWTDAIKTVQCNVKIYYRTESVAPYYSYLSGLGYGEAYANMDIGGGTSDILYVNPTTREANVFSAFFAANDLWNDGTDRVNRAAKANGFVTLYKGTRMRNLGEYAPKIEAVLNSASSSADIISYLFANDGWTRFSDTIHQSRTMMQLPIIHFSALTFYMAYALHMAEVDIPLNLTFTGMGSKYINLISISTKQIAQLVTKIFHYAGDVLDNSKLKEATICVSFAPNPKEVTATGALISLNYVGAITPSEDTYYGFEEEDPEKTMHYNDITNDVQDSVKSLYDKFVAMFQNNSIIDVLSEMEYFVDDNITEKLRRYAIPSFSQMKGLSSAGQRATDKLKEPMFFWPLKEALYRIGKEIAPDAIQEINGGNNHN